MIIAVMGAMQEEIAPFLKKFPNHQKDIVGGNVFYTIKTPKHTIVVAYSKIGKVHSALTASTMILKFGAQKLIFSGVAGGLNPQLKVGDLIIANKLCQYDVDITAFGHPLGFIPESSVYIDSSEQLNAMAKNVAKEKGIDLREGIIASGDSFIASSEKKKWLIDNFKADAVEMEGASVAVVCNLLNVDFCILRSISDSADSSADISFDEFLISAANTSANFVESMLEKI